MASDLNILCEIIKDSDTNDAIRWIETADTNTDFSGYRNTYNETVAQYCILVTVDEPIVASKLIDRMTIKDLENKDSDNNSLITSSIYYSSLLDQLLSAGVNPETRNADGITLFALVAELGFMKPLTRLVDEFNVEISDKESDSALVLAAMNNKRDTVIYLLELGVDLEDHFIASWGNKYLNELEIHYKRLDEYYDLFTKHELYELVPADVHEMFLF